MHLAFARRARDLRMPSLSAAYDLYDASPGCNSYTKLLFPSKNDIFYFNSMSRQIVISYNTFGGFMIRLARIWPEMFEQRFTDTTL
jgi:hypothetical protein